MTRLQCCDDIPLRCLSLYDQDLAQTYQVKVWEPTTINATYCSNMDCGSFLENSFANSYLVSCNKCSSQTCIRCKEPAHPNRACEEDEGRGKLLRLAKDQKWKLCPKCRVVIERTTGCKHMQCPRCRTAFCYRCGRTWEQCFEGNNPCTPDYFEDFGIEVP